MSRRAPSHTHSPDLRRFAAAGFGVCGFLLCVLASGAAHADSSSALVLRGVVPMRCEIHVDARAELMNLAWPQGELQVASVTETCNSATGYTVSVSSRQNGRLVGESDALDYDLRYGDARPDLSGSRSAAVAVAAGDARTSAEGVTRPVHIAIAGAPRLAGGFYEDTLVFTIAAR